MAGKFQLIPVDWLRSRYAYCPFTGEIRYRFGSAKMRGQIAGSIRYDGYRIIKISHGGGRVQVMAHILAWTLYHGEHPTIDVDHEDLDRTNNRIRNLRLGTRSQNLANRPNTGDLPKGVTRSNSKSKPYQAQISVDGVKRYLGLHACPVVAHQAYAAAAVAAFGEFARLQ